MPAVVFVLGLLAQAGCSPSHSDPTGTSPADSPATGVAASTVTCTTKAKTTAIEHWNGVRDLSGISELCEWHADERFVPCSPDLVRLAELPMIFGGRIGGGRRRLGSERIIAGGAARTTLRR